MNKLKALAKAGASIVLDKYYYKHFSFSQAGEDKVTEFFFESIGQNLKTYLDIGTNHPVKSNNTYLFYLKGAKGICIEPNPMLVRNIKKYRPRDTCLNVGITEKENLLMDFYIFDGKDTNKGLSTFSKQEADHVESVSAIRVSRIEKIPTITIQHVLKQYFHDKAPDFISLDVEGVEMEILNGIGFTTVRPLCICIETVDFSTNHKRTKREDIFRFMESKNYINYADTGINTIFIDKSLF